jgi:hypothetical protein
MINSGKEWRWMDNDDEFLEQGVDDLISTPKESGAVED